MAELFVETKKGLFVLHGEPAPPFDIATRAFPGTWWSTPPAISARGGTARR